MSAKIPYAAYFLSFPAVITGTGKYVTRSGETVTVERVDDHHWKRGHYADGTPERWHRSGRIFSGQETANDIIGPEPAPKQIAADAAITEFYTDRANGAHAAKAP
jgi:hypothetical protein